jgi:uracil-DNA glycosylase
MELNLTSDWKNFLSEELKSSLINQLIQFLQSEKKLGKKIYPKDDEIFEALRLTPVEHVKVVILGQDPYHDEGQAHGLCFSVKKGVKPPPSLVNIFKELQTDLGIPHPPHGCLNDWAQQGVLLLNTVLTVEHKKPASHAGKGWEYLTDTIIKKLSLEKTNLVYILWGNPAQRKSKLIDTNKHLILSSPHPSPLSCYRGFFGSKPFSKTNDYLINHGLVPIDWQIK